eukprot:COSAG03_NODE_31_length_18330_cov_15.424936_1_plen_28_part_10
MVAMVLAPIKSHMAAGHTGASRSARGDH